MVNEDVIKKKLRKLEEQFPEDAADIERDILPLQGEEASIKKKKSRD